MVKPHPIPSVRSPFFRLSPPRQYKLDSRVSELSSRLGAAEGEVKALRDAADRLQSQNGRIDVERAEQSRSLTDLKVSVTTLEQKVRTACVTRSLFVPLSVFKVHSKCR